MPKKQWWTWRNKREDNYTRNNDDVDSKRPNINEQSRTEGRKRRMHWRNATHNGEGQAGPSSGHLVHGGRERPMQSENLDYQQRGPRQENQGGRERLMQEDVHQQLGPSPRQDYHHGSNERLTSDSIKHQPRSSSKNSGSQDHQQAISRGQCNERNGASSAITSSNSSNIGRHIPGFYYDPVKNRYFRVFQGHNTNNPYSEENIRKKEAEKRRLELLHSNSIHDQSSPNDFMKTSTIPSINLIFNQRQQGKLSSLSYERQCHEACVARMSTQSSHQILTCPDTVRYGEPGYMNVLQTDKHQEKILTIISDSRFHRFWQATVTTNKHNASQIDLINWKKINCVGTKCSKVTSASWVSVDENQDNHILYTISGGHTSQIQLFERSPNSLHVILYNQSAYGMVWTSSWSYNKMFPNHLCVGGRKSYVVDIMTSVKTKINTNGTEVFCQAFAKSAPLLYNGTKRGEIFSFDFRTPSNHRRNVASTLLHKTSVCCLKLLNDENYIVASDMSGKIKMWDIRMCAVVREYHGNNNQLRHLPFQIDSTENILYTVGQDCFTRMWSLNTGNLLNTIPPPLPASKQTLPSIIYSTDWAASPGLLLATQKQLDWYSL
ncbi:DDB1- and CUL4-associated factor 4-like [Antedon mediterranea]|uniref:DDB1- and CUL4-associated factor 4-like n=1 Tax=Antedon mediterranea TaxID=105859 RepID=UPI003AF9D0CC